MVNAIQNSDDVSGLSVTAESGRIEMGSAAMNTVANALSGNGDQLSLKIDTVDINKIPSTQKYPIANVLNTAVFVELSAAVIHQDGSRDPICEFNGNVTVSIPYEQPTNMTGRQVIACHIADDGTITYFPVRYENGMVTFTTTHFSTFGIVESYAAAFGDIDISAWYANAVIWANQSGIVGGYGNGLFGPNDNITREQLAVMLWRYAGEPAATERELRFADADQASNYALDALRWAVENGVLNGYGDGQLNPRGLATRAQVAQMLKNYLQK